MEHRDLYRGIEMTQLMYEVAGDSLDEQRPLPRKMAGQAIAELYRELQTIETLKKRPASSLAGSFDDENVIAIDAWLLCAHYRLGLPLTDRLRRTLYQQEAEE